jgi:hypothetical protein
MYRVHAIGPNIIEEFRFASVNLAIGTFALSESLSFVGKGGNKSPASGLQVTL